ncbi:hypothetical protein WJX74_000668 [Apatococcus lobatus]|uniref:SGNH hydrolase-type esterase domain-containing protein n=1 Tax=Apatococcus lobatus TaxID=904363 RepID=A0AAW1RF23_9CHLO
MSAGKPLTLVTLDVQAASSLLASRSTDPRQPGKAQHPNRYRFESPHSSQAEVHLSRRFLSAPAVPTRRVEFVGDSLTVGFGNVGRTWCQITAASQSFAALTATFLDAQLQVTAWSGAGLTRSTQQPAALAVRLSAGSPPPNLPDFYRRSDGAQPSSLYDYNLYIPQLIVMAIGVNDFVDSSEYPVMEAWTQVYVGAINAMNAVYPGVKIVMMQYPEAMLSAFQPGSGSVTQGIDVLLPSNYPVYETYHQAAYNRAIAAGISNVYYFEPSARVGLFSRGCTGHPGLAGHQAISDELIPYLKGMMAW